jgi:hypothetical protein
MLNRFLNTAACLVFAAVAPAAADSVTSGTSQADESTSSAQSTAAETTASYHVKVVDGVVQPKQPVMQSIDLAMNFLRRADGSYVPGNISGDLAGYFTSAFVNEDGSRSSRDLAYPARQHAYFIFTFLQYAARTHEKEWTQRARDLAEWELAHSTPKDASWPNLPYSTWSKGGPGGSKDVDSIEPDKAAFVGSAYLALYDQTSETKYLDGAKVIAVTLVKHQREDGSWPFRVVPTDGTVRQDFGGAPVFFVQFFERLLKYGENAGYLKAHDAALRMMITRNVAENTWGTYHEDITEKQKGYLSAEPMSFTADYLFDHAKEHPEYVDMGRQIIQRMEERLVHTSGHPAAPAPAVSEQAGFEHMMPGHTARYCLALARLYHATGDHEAKRKALSGINALTYMQSEDGLFRTFFQLVHERSGKARPNWYSQHLYTVCHVLQAAAILPDIAR